MSRKYLENHSFLTFQLPQGFDNHGRTWHLLGQAYELTRHIGQAPLTPSVVNKISRIYLTKGIQATNAIEGNPMTEPDVAALLDGKPTKKFEVYHEREMRNVADLLNLIEARVNDSKLEKLSLEIIKDYNKRIIAGTEHEQDAVPGQLRKHSVGIANYRAVPSEDLSYLMDEYVKWINQLATYKEDDEFARFSSATIAAIFAHMYFAWIHPFGDGNGRTARMIEGHILLTSGNVPFPVFHLLSNHYNETRAVYTQKFDESRLRNNTLIFLDYALEGFVRGLQNQVSIINQSTLDIAWISFTDERITEKLDGKMSTRASRLIRWLTHQNRAVAKSELLEDGSAYGNTYVDLSEKTLTRDLKKLQEIGLIQFDSEKRILITRDIMLGFLPKRLES